VDQEMLAKLHPGMTRAQVKFVMGTPLVADVFHANRWDYIYMYRKDGKLAEERRAVLYFDGDKLDRIEDMLNDGTKTTPVSSDKAGATPAAATDKPATVTQ
jgi:Small protein A (tmRNA-binding)